MYRCVCVCVNERVAVCVIVVYTGMCVVPLHERAIRANVLCVYYKLDSVVLMCVSINGAECVYIL